MPNNDFNQLTLFDSQLTFSDNQLTSSAAVPAAVSATEPTDSGAATGSVSSFLEFVEKHQERMRGPGRTPSLVCGGSTALATTTSWC